VSGFGRSGRLVGTPPTLALLTTIVLSVTVPDASAQAPPPDDSYLTFETEHFRVVFPTGMETFARAAAGSAEWAYAALATSFIEPPSGRISLVIGDHADLPNASATPLPANRVTLIATPQISSRQLAFYTDWLDVALVHELTHIFHLDRAAGLWTVPRALFGRAAPFFPAFYQPTWVIEGLPTYFESRLTGAGRAYGGYFNTLVAGAAAAGRLVPVDAANGVVPRWPAGTTPYAYGGLYFRALAEQNGDSTLGAFTRHAAARLPYTLDWAAPRHFGHSLSAGWSTWRKGTTAAVQARLDTSGRFGFMKPEPLSEFTWSAPAARFSPDGAYLAFSTNDPRDDPATVVLDAASGNVVARHRRNTAGVTAWSRDGRRLYIDQIELTDRYRFLSDLYAVAAFDGHSRRITRGARIMHPDVAADGTIVAVQVGQGTNRLVLVGEDEMVKPLSPYAADVNWGRPRWSPNGDLIAAERWVVGAPLELVLLDPRSGDVTPVTDDAAADLAPTWSADGRYLLWSSDREGVFDVYAVDVRRASGPLHPRGRSARRVTWTAGGAFDPEVSPDGRWLVFAAQHARGFRLERVPYDPASWSAAGNAQIDLALAPYPSTEEPPDVGPVSRYSPFPSLWPTGWLPVVAPADQPEGWLLAAQIAGTDDLRRHDYALLFGWRTGVEDLEARATYSYRGWGDPVLRVSVSQTWDGAFARASDGSLVELVEREREARLTAGFLRPRIRSALSVTPSVAVERLRFYTPAGFTLAQPTFTDLEAAIQVGLSTARTHPRAISPANGVIAVGALEHERLADDLGSWRVTAEAEVRGYESFRVFGFADHALAVRLAAGWSEGRNRSPEIFDLGGVPGQALDLGGGIAVGGGERYHLRGYAEATQLGDRAVAASVEYRLPLVLVGRGHALWPILLEDLSLSAFLDAGSAWLDADRVRGLASTGVELGSAWVLGYALRYRFRAGLARRLVADRGGTTGWEGYVAVGLAF